MARSKTTADAVTLVAPTPLTLEAELDAAASALSAALKRAATELTGGLRTHLAGLQAAHSATRAKLSDLRRALVAPKASVRPR